MTELKPCPFCGSTDVHLLACINIREPEKMIFCMKCGAGMISGWFKEEDERLIEMWNRRMKNDTTSF